MRPVTVAFLGDPEYADNLGKKSTESDVVLRSYRDGDVLVSVVQPLRYPEKVQPLAYAVNAADVGVLVVKALTKEVGEQIVAANAAGLKHGVVVLQDYLDPSQVKPLLKGTTLEAWTFQEDKPAEVRAAVAALADKVAPGGAGPSRVTVDHHFNVKGVGEVVLGFVRGGPFKKHAEVRLWPTTKAAQVRSVQVHDEDVDEAHAGDHVGLALKGVETKDLDRGQVLAEEGALSVLGEKHNARLDISVSPFYKQGVDLGKVYALAVGWQIVPVKVKAGMAVPGAKGGFECEPQKAVAYAKGDHGLLLDADAKGLRVVGRVDLP